MESNAIFYRATKEDIENIKNSYLYKTYGEGLYVAHEEDIDCILFKTNDKDISNATLGSHYEESLCFFMMTMCEWLKNFSQYR